MRKFGKSDEAFTGLEAAIVLIAFVVVAAVFSYVMLGAGFFTSQKSQEVVHTSVDQASSSVQIVGDVVGLDNAGGTLIDTVELTLGLTSGGSAVDLSKTVVSYWNETTSEYLDFDDGDTNPPAAGDWSIINRQGGDADDLLEPGEMYTIMVTLTAGFPVNDKFSLEIKPPVGAVLAVKRTAPPQLENVNYLY